MYPGVYATNTPDRPAAIRSDTGETLTYRELEQGSARIARLLHERGLRRGDSFAVLSENTLRMYELHWAALRSGLYVTAVNHHLQRDEIAYIVDDCGARALFTSAGNGPQARGIVDLTPRVDHRFSFGGDAVPGHEDLDAALADVPADPLDDDRVGADMLYSSGTTGRPKAVKVPLTEARVGDPDPFVTVFSSMYGFDVDTVYLCPAPLYHAAPLRFSRFVVARGGTVVLMPAFEPVAALEAVERHRVTHSQWVPTMFVRMLKLPEQQRHAHDLSSQRWAIHAAAPCPVEVKRAMIDWWGPILAEYYSSTEGNGVTFVDSAQWLERPGTVGRAGLGVLHVCGEDPAGTEVPTGEVGLVYFERDELPFSYHNDPAGTRAAQHPQHPTWTTTGDVGYVDDAGYLYLTDRKAFMIISGGVNIYPQESEDVLTLHPKVFDVAVIGIPDDEMGEQVKAVVQPAPGVDPGPELEAELLAYVRERLAHYKAPRSVDFADRLPRTATGKLQKRLLVQQYR